MNKTVSFAYSLTLPSLMSLRYLLLCGWLLSGFNSRAQAALTKLGSIVVPSYGTELVVSGTTAYVFTASAGQQGVRIYDVSTPAAPRLLSTLALPNATNLSPLPPRHAVVSNGMLCVTSYHTNLTTPHFAALWTIDVRDPANPSVRSADGVVGEEDFVAASGDYFYVLPDDRNQVLVYNRTPVTGPGYSYLYPERTIDLPYSLSGIIGVSFTGTTAYVQYANGVFATLDMRNAAQPVSSPGTTPGTITAVSGTLAAGLAQPVYAGSVPSNTLRFYSLNTPLQPALLRSQAGSYGTQVAVGTQHVFTCGKTSPFVSAVPSSAEPLRGYFLASSGSAPLEAMATDTNGANALVAANNMAYVLTDTEFSIYAFPATVTATRGAATLAPLALYPNPATRTVQVIQATAGSSVAVYDLTGRICLQAKLPPSGTLDVSALSAGLYQVRTDTAVGKLTIQ
jgi:hypothetical protein